MAAGCTPHPDDDSDIMSFAMRLGGERPKPPTVSRDATVVKVKTTKVVLKVHTHQSKVIRVDEPSAL